jgi:multicomponent Na+:H+ antiporter subunit B
MGLTLLFVLAIVVAVLALEVADLLAAVALLSVFSFLVALLYSVLGAVDVGYNEAVLGAGVTGVYFVVLIARTRRRAGR